MVDLDVVARKIANASARLADVDRLLAKPRREFLADVERRDLTAFYVQLAIQECIDLASHWLSESDWQLPDDAGSAFDVLADHDLITRDLATTMRQTVGLRNLIARGYAAVTSKKMRAARAAVIIFSHLFLQQCSNNLQRPVKLLRFQIARDGVTLYDYTTAASRPVK